MINSILFRLNTCKTLCLWYWKLDLWWIVLLVQADGLLDVIRWFKYILSVFTFLANVNKYYWLDVINSIISYLNTCNTLYLWGWKLVLYWVIVFEQSGGLNYVIRWFKYLLKVFFISCKCEWVLFIWCDELYFIWFKYLWCWKLDLWWVIVLDPVGSFHGVIRWFKYILGVYFISGKCERVLFIRSDELYFIWFK